MTSLPRNTARHLMAGLLAAAVTSTGAYAHEGHDHAETPPPVEATNVEPRIGTNTDLYELVTVLSRGQLVMYLDQYADNAPINDAQVDVETGSWKGRAKRVGDGIYAVAAPASLAQGTHALSFTITQGTSGDLLDATLVAGPADVATQHSQGSSVWVIGLALLLLTGLTVFVLRAIRLKRRSKP